MAVVTSHSWAEASPASERLFLPLEQKSICRSFGLSLTKWPGFYSLVFSLPRMKA